jgi:hypothetical protein
MAQLSETRLGKLPSREKPISPFTRVSMRADLAKDNWHRVLFRGFCGKVPPQSNPFSTPSNGIQPQPSALQKMPSETTARVPKVIGQK